MQSNLLSRLRMDPQGNFSTSYSAFYNMGIDYSTYPSARTSNFGIKLTLK